MSPRESASSSSRLSEARHRRSAAADPGPSSSRGGWRSRPVNAILLGDTGYTLQAGLDPRPHYPTPPPSR
ncbi:hypothetical protein CVS40_10997 [Lucilia cuprina]|nr:hypothetical protein CVS40_10997 [Lucilia cuprina]